MGDAVIEGFQDNLGIVFFQFDGDDLVKWLKPEFYIADAGKDLINIEQERRIEVLVGLFLDGVELPGDLGHGRREAQRGFRLAQQQQRGPRDLAVFALTP